MTPEDKLANDMRIRTLVLILITVAMTPQVSRALPDWCLPSQQVRPGMVGTGLTVINGTAIETFEAEILGVVANAATRNNMIIAKLSGLDLEESGVIAGMSGSPVYIDGKLIGAVAYGWAFSKIPLTGIEPIENMLELLERDFDAPLSLPQGAPTQRSGAGSWQTTLHRWQALRIGQPLPAWSDRAPADRFFEVSGFDHGIPSSLSGQPIHGGWERLATPISLSRASASLLSRANELLNPHGLTAVAGGARLPDGVEPPQLEPGSALGVQLIAGDLSASAVGTVTFRVGEQVVGFGHPMFMEGHTDFPATTAYIHAIVPSVLRSFKLGSPVEMAGALRQDRFPGVGVQVGPAPVMLPVELTVNTADGQTRVLNYEVVRSRGFTGLLTAIALWDGFDIEGDPGRGTIRYDYTIPLPDGKTITSRNMVAGTGYHSLMLAFEMFALMDILANNPFQSVLPTRVEMTARFQPEYLQADIYQLVFEPSRAKPGQQLRGFVRIRPQDRPMETVPFEVQVPWKASAGKHLLMVQSAQAAQMLEYERIPDRYTPRDFASLVEVLDENWLNHQLWVTLLDETQGAVRDGRESARLPASVLEIMGAEPAQQGMSLTKHSVVQRVYIDTPYMLVGQQQTVLEVEIDEVRGLRP